MLGAASFPGRSFGDGGDYIGMDTISKGDTVTGVVADQSAPYLNSYWMNQSGDIFSGGNGESGTVPGQKVLDSLDENGIWKYLAEVDISETKHFVTFNNTEDKVYIRNAGTGAEWNSWTAPTITKGVTVQGDIILCYNRGINPPKIEKFSLTGTHLDDMFLPYPTLQANRGMAINPNTEDIIMNLGDDSGFYVISFTNETEYSSHQTFNYSVGGPAGNKVINDISFDSDDNLVLTLDNDPDIGNVDLISWYRNEPTPTPSPTPEGYKPPTPTPEFTSTATPSPPVTPSPEIPPSRIGIFRPTSGLWAISDTTRAYFGGSGDTPLFRDYDGDCTTDIAVFRSASGLWAVRGVTRAYFGGNGDEPVPADYTGDSQADIGIFRTLSGLWAIRGVTRLYFGSADDAAVPSDYDGDGSADVGVFRDATGLWAVRGVTRAYFGGTDDTPVPGDYSGDGISKIGIFRPSSGLWAIRALTRSYFGGADNEPVPGDYDGDGTEDIGIFRDISDLWAIREVTRAYFGGVGDIPVAR